LEWTRTYLIAKYQDQKPNPFVLDCSLAKRSYCSQSPNCSQISATDAFDHNEISISPNPFNAFIEIHTDTRLDAIDCTLYNSMGHQVNHTILNLKTSGTRWNLEDLAPGYYFAVFSNSQKKSIKRVSIIKN
ncbi:MAG: T9SS type A sorting domain-containing protein, partial [Saprospiraceae bacterium]